MKEGSGTINNLYFSGEGSSLIIYSDNPSGNIKITSLSEYIEFYYWNETKSRIQNIVDFSHGGKFIMEKDLPFDFYTRVDGPKDITFNIEFLKLECVEKIEISKHLFEVIAYVMDKKEINNLINNKDYKPPKNAFIGYYESMLSLGTIVIKKEEITNYIVSSSDFYLYVIIKKSPEVNITYNYTEGQFIFVSMDYIYSTIPAGFMISSHLSEGQKTPHLYTFEGRNITIEISYIGVELIFKIIKYKIYQTGTEEFYEDYSGFIIKRREEKNKKYIDVIQRIQENEENEGNTTSSKLILSIFSNNTDHVAGNNTTSISYSMRYETHPYIDFDDDTDYISENNTVIDTENNTEVEIDIPPPFTYLTADVILLGFSKFIYIKEVKISYFSIYFGCIGQVAYTKILIVTVKIQYKLSLRKLQDETTQAKCELLDNEFKNINKFVCTLNTNGEEIDNIKIDNYDFQNQTVNIIEETAIAKKYKNNLQNVGNDLFNKKLYILDNAARSVDNQHNEFNITGTMNEIFNYEKVKLTINTENANEGYQNVSCKVIKVSDVDYILNCKTENELKAELKGVFADLGNANLIVHFIDEGNSTIDFEPILPEGGIVNKTSEKKKRFSAWAIIGIIIACSVAVLIILIIIVCLYHKKQVIVQDTAANKDFSTDNLN